MQEITAKDKFIINEWKQRQLKYEKAKQELTKILAKHGAASREFNAARVDFEMFKEEFDNFEKEHHKILSEYK